MLMRDGQTKRKRGGEREREREKKKSVRLLHLASSSNAWFAIRLYPCLKIKNGKFDTDDDKHVWAWLTVSLSSWTNRAISRHSSAPSQTLACRLFASSSSMHLPSAPSDS